MLNSQKTLHTQKQTRFICAVLTFLIALQVCLIIVVINAQSSRDSGYSRIERTFPCSDFEHGLENRFHKLRDPNCGLSPIHLQGRA